MELKFDKTRVKKIFLNPVWQNYCELLIIGPIIQSMLKMTELE